MKTTPGATVAEKEKFWTEIIEAARSYPGGVAKYLSLNNHEKNCYYYWFKRLRVFHPAWTNLGGIKKGKSAARPTTEVPEKRTRRGHTASYRARIVAEYDSAAPGTKSAILRREGLYSHQVKKWSSQLSVTKSAKVETTGPSVAEFAKLNAKLAKSEKSLKTANELIELQKKISDILGVSLRENAASE
jgi:transposase